MRRLLVGLGCALLLTAAAGLLSASVSLVVTYGNSMAPRVVAGDLVLVRATGSYTVGDVVAYRSQELDRVVLHRIVAQEHDRLVLRGDHNAFIDPDRPTSRQVVGEELLHVPGGGVWLNRIASFPALGLVALGVVLAGRNTVVRRRRAAARRQRRTKTRTSTMAQHTNSTSNGRARAVRPPRVQVLLTLAAGASTLGLLLGALSWLAPTGSPEPVPAADAPSMTFGYHADVAPSPAYDDTRVSEPDPVFRKLADEVVVRYAYRGEPGAVSVAVELSTDSGWRSTVPLQPSLAFDTTEHTGEVLLELGQLEARAEAAADAIGIPAPRVDLAVVPTVTTEDGETFAARLPFSLTPVQLSLVGDEAALSVGGMAPARPASDAADTVRLVGHEVTTGALRAAALVLVLASLLLLCPVAAAVVRARSAGEAAVIRQRYARLLLPVAPMTTPAGRPVVDVTDFSTLARLAERYGAMIMHWSRSDIDTFLVHDDGVAYRYRTGAGHAAAHDDDVTDEEVADLDARTDGAQGIVT